MQTRRGMNTAIIRRNPRCKNSCITPLLCSFYVTHHHYHLRVGCGKGSTAASGGKWDCWRSILRLPIELRNISMIPGICGRNPELQLKLNCLSGNWHWCWQLFGRKTENINQSGIKNPGKWVARVRRVLRSQVHHQFRYRYVPYARLVSLGKYSDHSDIFTVGTVSQHQHVRW